MKSKSNLVICALSHYGWLVPVLSLFFQFIFYAKLWEKRQKEELRDIKDE